jgi:hypothetical protein
MHCNKELSMGAFVPTLILLALPITQLGVGGPDNAQTIKELKVTVLHSHNAEAGSHEVLVPPTESGGGTAETYCQATANSQGHVASIGYGGSLVLNEHSFGLTVTGHTVHPASFGMFTFGSQPYNVPFGNGYLCVAPFAPGIYRMPVQALTQPTLVLAMEDAGASFDLIQPGSSWYFQFWYRDPPAGGSNFNLSNGLHVVFAPNP